MSKCKWIVLLVLLICFAAKAEAKVYLDVYGQSYKRITVAVPPFKSEEKQQKSEMSDLLGHDLDVSGFFIVAPPAQSWIRSFWTKGWTERRSGSSNGSP